MQLVSNTPQALKKSWGKRVEEETKKEKKEHN